MNAAPPAPCIFCQGTDGAVAAAPPAKGAESGPAGRRTHTAVKGADALLEALSMAQEEMEKWKEYHADRAQARAMQTTAQREAREKAAAEGTPLAPLVAPPKPNLRMLNMTPAKYVCVVCTCTCAWRLHSQTAPSSSSGSFYKP